MTLNPWSPFILGLILISSTFTRAADSPGIHYFFSASENFNERKIEITGQSAIDNLGAFSSLGNEPCLIEIAKVVDKAIKEVNGPLLNRFATQTTRRHKEPISVTFSTSVYDKILTKIVTKVGGVEVSKPGPPGPDSFHCNLIAQVREGVYVTGGVVLTYDRLQHQFLSYNMNLYDDHGLSNSKADYVAKSILDKTYPELLDMMNATSQESYNDALKAKADAEKQRSQRAHQSPNQANQTEEQYLEQSRQH